MNFVQFQYVSLVIKGIIKIGQFDVYKVLQFWMSFILCKTKLLILKNCGWPYIDDFIIWLEIWIYVLL
jgi:hypothetical protein